MQETVPGFGFTFTRARPVVVPGNSPTGAANRPSSRGVRAVPVLPLPGCAIAGARLSGLGATIPP